MASGGGPRAAGARPQYALLDAPPVPLTDARHRCVAPGSGIKEEGKFRQRVDDHYRLMASAKKTIGLAGRLQLASALGLGTAMGVAATLPESGSMVAGAASAVLMLVSAGASRAATAAAGTKDVEKHGVAYAGWLRKLALLIVVAIAGATGAAAAELVEAPPQPVVVAMGAVGALDLAGCVIGLRGAKQLQQAFEAQKAKAKAK